MTSAGAFFAATCGGPWLSAAVPADKPYNALMSAWTWLPSTCKAASTTSLVVLWLLPLSGCNLLASTTPCVDDHNCPTQMPVCVDRVCQAADVPPFDGGDVVDGGRMDAGVDDAGRFDAGPPDAGTTDDAGPNPDGGDDAGLVDAGLVDDAGVLDAGVPDGGPVDDAGVDDAGVTDAGLVVPFPYNPSNIDADLFQPTAVVDWTGCTSVVVDTDEPLLSEYNGCDPALPQTGLVVENNAADLRVLAMVSLVVPAELVVDVRGENALALLVSTDATLDGVFDLSGAPGERGPGGRADCNGSGDGGDGENSTNNVERGSGGGGGGYGSDGAGGGTGDDGNAAAGEAGMAHGNPDDLKPLKAGCDGGKGGGGQNGGGHGGDGGGGGGGLQVSVGGTLTLNGVVLANGGGGGTTTAHRVGGGGGGSGGAILLEADHVEGAGSLFAVGGGGGAGGGRDASNTGPPGESPGQGNGGNGGNGVGAGFNAGGNGGMGAGASGGPAAGQNRRYGGGGGGGGLGRIVVEGRSSCGFSFDDAPAAFELCP